MTIDKAAFESAVRKVRGAYQQHQVGALSGRQLSSLSSRAFRELNHLHEKALIDKTVARVLTELASYQKQFGLTLTINQHVGYNRKGICSSMISLGHPRLFWPAYNDAYLSIYVDQQQSWDKVAVHTAKELENWSRPSLYTKRHANRWKSVETFDFAGLLAKMHDMVHEPYNPAAEEDEVPF